MDFFKNFWPPIKLPNMKKWNKGSFINLSQSSCQRITNNILDKVDALQHRRTNKCGGGGGGGEIATVSSLVDNKKNLKQYNLKEGVNNRIRISTVMGYDYKRDNYGLYAMKCERSAARNSGILLNVPGRMYSSASQRHNSDYSFTREMTHEKYSPFKRHNRVDSVSVGGKSTTFDYVNNEIFKIEFNDERIIAEATDVIVIKESACGDNEKMFSSHQTAYHKPLKKAVGAAKHCETIENLNNAHIIPPPRKRRLRQYKQLQYDESLKNNVDDSIKGVNQPDNYNSREKSALNQQITNEPNIMKPELKLRGNKKLKKNLNLNENEKIIVRKNKSELYRIVESNVNLKQSSPLPPSNDNDDSVKKHQSCLKKNANFFTNNSTAAINHNFNQKTIFNVVKDPESSNNLNDIFNDFDEIFTNNNLNRHNEIIDINENNFKKSVKLNENIIYIKPKARSHYSSSSSSISSDILCNEIVLNGSESNKQLIIAPDYILENQTKYNSMENVIKSNDSLNDKPKIITLNSKKMIYYDDINSIKFDNNNLVKKVKNSDKVNIKNNFDYDEVKMLETATKRSQCCDDDVRQFNRKNEFLTKPLSSNVKNSLHNQPQLIKKNNEKSVNVSDKKNNLKNSSMNNDFSLLKKNLFYNVDDGYVEDTSCSDISKKITSRSSDCSVSSSTTITDPHQIKTTIHLLDFSDNKSFGKLTSEGRYIFHFISFN